MDLQDPSFPSDPEYIQLSGQVLLNCRNELYSLFPYLDGAFAGLPWKPGRTTIGTDGMWLLFDPEFPVRVYGEEPRRLRRGFLHILLHCLYLHPFRRGNICPQRWNLACDMAVEQIITRENQPRLEIPASPVRRACLELLGPRPLSAEQICRMLEEFPFSQEQMAEAFRFDDHSLWNAVSTGGQTRWTRILSYTSQNRQQHSQRRGSRAGTRSEVLEPPEEGIHDYRKFLQKFAVPREEMELDMDSFDYIYYNLGMEQYGNLPLIEPLEYREGNKLEELVIAIDTSGSCSKETVRSFLTETYSILSHRENFFRKMKVHLIQCDCVIQSAVVIHSREEWMNYSRSITIQGRGGTDFTPVFRYVDEKRKSGELRKLKALLYFTDGDGVFPREKPAYETAFVFVKPTDTMKTVPGWARVLLVNDRGSL